MRVFEVTEECGMKALKKILSEQGAYELISKAAEITVEMEGNVHIVDGQKVISHVQDIISENADLKFRMEPSETQGEKVQLIMLVKEEESLLKKVEEKLEKIWQNRN